MEYNVGAGLIDFLITDQTDPDTGDTLFNWGVYNDEDRKYRNFETPDTIHDAMYIMKANAPINSECYAYTQSQMRSGKIRFLIDENLAKNKLLAQEQSKRMSVDKRNEYLKPYTLTSVLRDQMMNLVQDNDGANIILKQATRTIKKDKYSALMYALYWCKLEEETKKNKKVDFSKLMLFTKH